MCYLIYTKLNQRIALSRIERKPRRLVHEGFHHEEPDVKVQGRLIVHDNNAKGTAQ